MSETHDVVLHPIGLAGWLGLYSNLWHLFPAGRFDGGRLAYALWGYKRANTLGWLTIAVLVVLGSAWPGWWVMAAFAAITMIRIRTQHPIDAHAEPINTSARRLIWACAAVLALTFVPVPVRFSPPPDTEGVISRREVETWPCPCLTSPGGWRTQGGVEFFV
jgi:membrane-associated protease RseP (regulator of RpoE activity)